jgi:protein-disulfide isomerase
VAERLGLRGALDVMAAIAMISASVFLMWSVHARATGRGGERRERGVVLPSAPVSLTGLQQIGSMSARVVGIEYSDFECPFCARFATGTWPQIKRDYVEKGLLRVAFSHLPLDGIHGSARRAAEISECAAEQGQFWAIHDLFFAKQSGLQELLSEPRLGSELRSLGVTPSRLASCLSAGVADRVEQNRQMAVSLNITGTPTFLVGLAEGQTAVRIRERLEGAVSLTSFAVVIDKLMKDPAR